LFTAKCIGAKDRTKVTVNRNDLLAGKVKILSALKQGAPKKNDSSPWANEI